MNLNLTIFRLFVLWKAPQESGISLAPVNHFPCWAWRCSSCDCNIHSMCRTMLTGWQQSFQISIHGDDPHTRFRLQFVEEHQRALCASYSTRTTILCTNLRAFPPFYHGYRTQHGNRIRDREEQWTGDYGDFSKLLGGTTTVTIALLDRMFEVWRSWSWNLKAQR